MPDPGPTTPPLGPDMSPPASAAPPSAQEVLLLVSRGLAAAPLLVHDRLTLIADAIVPALADWCVIDVLASPDEPRQVVIRHADPALTGVVRTLQQRHSPNPFAPFGVADALWDASPRLIWPVDAERIAASAVDQEHARNLAALDLRSCLTVPLIAHDRAIGVMSWATSGRRAPLNDDQRTLAWEMAAVAAAAIESARQHETQRLVLEAGEHESGRLQQLLAAATALGTATTAEAIGTVLQTVLGRTLQARTCLVAEVHEHLRPVALPGWGDTDPTTWGDLLRAEETPFHDVWAGGEAIFVEDGRHLRAAYPLIAPFFDRERTETLAVVPLQPESPDGGILAVGFDLPRRLSDGERRFIQSLAVHVAHALERVRLLAAETRLVQERDSLMRSLSHDLKNPLTVIQMHAHMMQQGDERERKRAESIQQATDRMVRLIENLNDLTRLVPGLDPIERQTFSPESVALAALADVSPLLPARSLTVQPHFAKGLPAAVGDSGRLQRALVNVLVHSLRRSPHGGEIRLDVTVAEGQLAIAIADDGTPIRPEDGSTVFDAYSLKAKGGSYTDGIGMVVARDIARAHGGDLTIVPSRGCTMRLTLPLT